MKRMVWISLLSMAFAPVHLFAQGRIPSESALDSVLNPPMLKGDRMLLFEKSDIHIGTISEDDAPSTYRFTFTNVSQKEITISKVVTSCGCMEAKVEAKVVKPKEKGTIILTFNPYEKVGTVDNKAFIYTHLSERYPTAKIALVGEVTPSKDEWKGYPCAMGMLRLKRATVHFNDLSRDGIRTERMVCVNSGKTELRLSALIIPSYAKLCTKPEVILPGKEADIVITIDGRLLPATLKDTFSFPIVIEGLRLRPSDRTIQVKASFAK